MKRVTSLKCHLDNACPDGRAFFYGFSNVTFA